MAEGGEDNDSGVAYVKHISMAPGISGSATLAEGENVNLKFIKSPLNVVAGDQINVNKLVYNITGAEGKTPSGIHGVNYEKLIEVINDNTREETASGIREYFKNEFPHEPDFEVFPQMKKVNVDDYYKGRFPEKKSSTDETGQGSRRKDFQSHLIEEVGFYRQSDNDGLSITMEKIMESLSKKLPSNHKVGYTAIVASAGSGKTTLMRRIAQKALGISSVSDNGETKRKMIHYIELKNMDEESGIKTSKFLFDGLFKNESEEDQAFEWLVENQSDAIIIFDGLDQMQWDLEECSLRNITPYKKASSAIIMYNILSRKILRHVRIIVSSREFKVSELPVQARPEEIITLNGLTPQDAYKLFTCLLRENGRHLWEKIEIMSPRLLQLVSVPVFLILIAVVMGIDPDRPPPSTVTELYSRIMLVLRSVENIRNRKEILSIINKLKAMAFEGMKEGRVVFYKADLDRFGVFADEVQDLMTKVPDNNILSCHLMEGDFTFFFCHQSMQEFLAASFISEMELETFSRFDDQHLHEKRWSVVRRFVTGIVYMQSTSDLHSVSDQTQKQEILSQSFSSQLKTGANDRDVRMELYTALCESGDDNLMKDLSVIDTSFTSLNRDEAHIVGSLAARNQSHGYLNLTYCRIDDELLSIIARCLENRIRMKQVNLKHNNFSAKALRSFLGHRRIESLSGKLDWEVVQLTVEETWLVELKNEEDVIKISRSADGRFIIKDSNLSFDWVHAVADVSFLGILFDAEFIKFKEQIQLLAKQDDLRNISECKLNKISNILLNCTKEEENIDWSLIETCCKKYQLDLLDIAVTGRIPVQDYSRIWERGKAISVFVNIHAMFYIEKADQFKKTLEACQQKKIEYIRCIFSYGRLASVADISSLISNSNLKKVTLIYLIQDDMLQGDKLQKVQKIANDLDTELEVLESARFHIDVVKNAWQRLDYDFFTREWMIRRRMQQRISCTRANNFSSSNIEFLGVEIPCLIS